MWILVGGGLMLTVGDLFMKRWVASASWAPYAAGMAFWLVGLVLLAAGLKGRSVALASVILIFSNVALLALAERCLFHTVLTWRQFAGLVLGAVAIALIGE